jgi:hypothetical protein
MNTEQFSATAQQLIASFDNNAHRAIDAWRTGGERLGAAARQRWDTAFAESRRQLSAETRRNATRARDAFAGCYAKGMELSTGGAETAVDTLVQAAQSAVERAAAWQQARS